MELKILKYSPGQYVFRFRGRVQRVVVVFSCILVLIYFFLVRYEGGVVEELSSEEYEQKYLRSKRSTNDLRNIIKCYDKGLDYRIAQKMEYWVLYNYVPASRSFACHESITYVTHGDFTFLGNLEPLVERWRGPVSLALFAPGSDFNSTLASIRYLRKCSSSLISEYVTFHLYFGNEHLRETIPKSWDVGSDKEVDCAAPPLWFTVSRESLYRTQKHLTYPVNVGRNLARDAAQTHYILVSDIELFPSPGVIPNFLDMVQRQDPALLHERPKIFPLPIFEVEEYVQPPLTKQELVYMLKNETAITFHKRICQDCHTIPKEEEWIEAPVNPGLHVFYVTERRGRWEPIYIGTNSDPYYDEKLSWEGLRDKMSQGYALCVLEYEFQILDNAFLVHKPGIKKKQGWITGRGEEVHKNNDIIKNITSLAMTLLYGRREGCSM